MSFSGYVQWFCPAFLMRGQPIQPTHSISERKKGSSLFLTLVGIQTINMYRISPVMLVVNIALSKVLIFCQRFKFRLLL